MEAAALPLGLQHLAPMPSETVFLLGVIAFMGTGNHDFIHPFIFEKFGEGYEDWNEDYGDLYEAYYGEEVNFSNLVDRDVLEPFEMFDKSIVYIPRYDHAEFINCLTCEQKSSLFVAALMLLYNCFPPGQLDGSMYLNWPACKRYGGHIRSLAVHWDALYKCGEAIEVPPAFLSYFLYCAEYMRETNDRHNAILVAEVTLKIIDHQDLSEFSELRDLFKAYLFTIKGAVSIQLLDYATAQEALGKSIEIYERYNPVGDDLEILTSQAHLASLAAAQGEYEDAVHLSQKVWQLLSSPHFNGRNGNRQRILQIKIATLAGKVATLVGKYSEANIMLDLASNRFAPAIDNPGFNRAILHALGNLHYAKGSMAGARTFFNFCTQVRNFGNVMHVNQADEERTISIYHRLAVMDIQDEWARAARLKVQAALKMCKETRSPNMLPWKGRLELTWAEILRKFEYFAGCWEREEKDIPEKHEEAAQQAAAELGIVTVGLVKDEQFAKLLPWDIL